MSTSIELKQPATVDGLIEALTQIKAERGGDVPVKVVVDDDYYTHSPLYVTAYSLGKGRGSAVEIL